MTADELQNELAQVQVLRHLTYPALRRVVLSGRLVQAKTGQLIIAPGVGSRGFFVILAGSVCVQMSNGVVLGHLGPRQYFGEIALLEGVERTAACRANADTVLFEVSPQTFHSDLVSNPMVKAGMLATVKLRRTVQERVKHVPGLAAAAQAPAAIPHPTAPAATPAGLPARPAVPSPGLPPRPTLPPRPGLPLTPGTLPPRPAVSQPQRSAGLPPRASLYATA